MADLHIIEAFLNIDLTDRDLFCGRRKNNKNQFYRFRDFLIVHLTRNKWMLIDNTAEAYDLLRFRTWCYMGNGYPCTFVKGVLKYYHQIAIDQEDDLETDHINREKFDNRTINLRLVTHSENLKNRKAWKWKPRIQI